jgi:hypothetical protein
MIEFICALVDILFFYSIDGTVEGRSQMWHPVRDRSIVLRRVVVWPGQPSLVTVPHDIFCTSPS